MSNWWQEERQAHKELALAIMLCIRQCAQQKLVPRYTVLWLPQVKEACNWQVKGK
jgi:hypothetical protein